MKKTIIIITILYLIGLGSADISLEFSNMNVSDYNIEIFNPNKDLVKQSYFNSEFNLSGDTDYIVQIKPYVGEALNSTNIVSYTENRLDNFASMAWLFGLLFMFVCMAYFMTWLVKWTEGA